MTDLTEQWKKGELKEGEEYWVILTDEWYLRNPVEPVRAFYSCECEFEGYLDDDIKEVLAPVPSYKKYTSLVNWKEDLTELCKVKERIIKKYENTDAWWNAKYTELKEENTKLKTENKWYSEQLNEGVKEMAKLKELLKECKEVMSTGGYIFATVKQVKRARKLLENIDQALGEDK